MARLVFLQSVTVLVSLAFLWCASERTAATRTFMTAKDVETPGMVFAGDAAGRGKEQLESGGVQLKNDSISHISVKAASDKPGEVVIKKEVEKMLQNASSASPPAAKKAKTQQPFGEPPINATEKEVLIKEKVKNASEEMEKDFTGVSVRVKDKQSKAIGLDGETEKETIAKTEAQDPNSEQEIAVQADPGKGSPSKCNETVIITEKKNETSPDGMQTKITETEVKMEPGRKTQKEFVIEKKDETSSEPKKEKLTKKEVEIKDEEETEKEVIIEKKGETSQEPRVEKITEREIKKEPGKEEVVQKAVVQKQDENGTEKETSEKSTVKSVITVQKPDEDKKGTVENVTLVKSPIKDVVPREPAEEVEAEKKPETTTDKVVKEEVPKPAKKITPVEKAPLISSLIPLLPEHVTDGTDESGYEYESVSPSRRCLRPRRHGCRCAGKRIVACRILEGIHCSR